MSDLSRKQEILSKSSLFGGLDEEIIKYLAEIADLRNYPSDTIIIEEDELGDSLFLIVKGIVQILKTKSKGAFKTLAVLREGDFMGEMSLIDSEPRSASAKAITDTEMLVIEKYELEKLFDTNPRAFAKIIHSIALIMAKRLRATDRELLSMVGHNVFL